MRAFAATRDTPPADLIGRVLCHDVPGGLRKGHALREEDLAVLFQDRDEVHLLELGPDDVGQKEAGRRLASAFHTPGLEPHPSGHRHVLRAERRGLLVIDAAALQRMNAIPGIAVFTLPNGTVVAPQQVVVHAQITPLAIDGRSLREAEDFACANAVVRLRELVPRDAILWKRDERLVAPLGDMLQGYGCRLRTTLDLPPDAASIGASLEAAIGFGATLLLVAGTNALDPLDPVFVALEHIGATVRRKGMPVHPGTLLWIATHQGATIIGLPSCGLRGAFELVLPRVLAGEGDFSALGHGGVAR